MNTAEIREEAKGAAGYVGCSSELLTIIDSLCDTVDRQQKEIERLNASRQSLSETYNSLFEDARQQSAEIERLTAELKEEVSRRY